MTNLEAKQEAIKNAYGAFWNRLSDSQKEYALNNNGNVQIGYSKEQSQLYKDMINSDLFLTQPIFPKSLQGIENNNGWIKIESDEDLPKNDMYVRITFNKKMNIAFLCDGEFYNPNKVKYYKKGVTHYKPIEETNPPIF